MMIYLDSAASRRSRIGFINAATTGRSTEEHLNDCIQNGAPWKTSAAAVAATLLCRLICKLNLKKSINSNCRLFKLAILNWNYFKSTAISLLSVTTFLLELGLTANFRPGGDVNKKKMRSFIIGCIDIAMNTWKRKTRFTLFSHFAKELRKSESG